MPGTASVVVMTHNRRTELRRTLRLLTALPEQPPIIVADNGASDGTVAAVRREFPGIRNTLWTAWLRRPVPVALRRTVAVLRQVPRDRATLAALVEAARGVPWVLRERRVVPPAVEAALRTLEPVQLCSNACRYVG